MAAPAADRADWQRVIDIVDDAAPLLGIDCVRLDTLPASDRLRRNIEAEGIALYRRDDGA